MRQEPPEDAATNQAKTSNFQCPPVQSSTAIVWLYDTITIPLSQYRENYKRFF